MRPLPLALLLLCAMLAPAQQPATPTVEPPTPNPNATALVGRLDLERYKATIKGLTQFGDRRQGTDRNRAAIDWIEARLKSYGCGNTVRLKYDYSSSAPRSPSGPAIARTPESAAGGGRYRGARVP